MKSFKGPKTQNEVQSDDKLIWESFVSREDSEDTVVYLMTQIASVLVQIRVMTS